MKNALFFSKASYGNAEHTKRLLQRPEPGFDKLDIEDVVTGFRQQIDGMVSSMSILLKEVRSGG